MALTGLVNVRVSPELDRKVDVLAKVYGTRKAAVVAAVEALYADHVAKEGKGK